MAVNSSLAGITSNKVGGAPPEGRKVYGPIHVFFIALVFPLTFIYQNQTAGQLSSVQSIFIRNQASQFTITFQNGVSFVIRPLFNGYLECQIPMPINFVLTCVPAQSIVCDIYLLNFTVQNLLYGLG